MSSKENGTSTANANKPVMSSSKSGDRKKRLAEQLRKNLRNRKAQARQRQSKDKSDN